MEYLRLNQIRVPRVYGWSSTTSNTVGAEYIIMEKLDGITVGDVWYTLSFKERYKVVEQIVQLEKRLLLLQLPANGSIYFPHDLGEHERSQSFLLSVQGHEFCIGDIDVNPFTIPHDAADPCGFVFHTRTESIRMAVATDLGGYRITARPAAPPSDRLPGAARVRTWHTAPRSGTTILDTTHA